jgi:hypothetical protein
MPERHRTEKLLSEQEAKMIRSLARILPAPMLGQPRYSLFPTIPLTSLFSNEPGNSWYSYVQNNLRDVIRLDDSDFVPNDTIRWPAGSRPPFRWSEPSEKYPIGTAIFNIGGDYTKGRTVWSKRDNRVNTDWLRNVYRGVQEAEIFFEAMTNSSSEEEMNGILNANYPRFQLTPFDERVRNLYSTSIDAVVAYDSGWDMPLESTASHGTIVPLYGCEYDGMTGAGIVEGELRWTEALVGDIHRDDRGHIDLDSVEYRIQKIDDKIRIARDIGNPMVVLFHTALTVVGVGPQAFMLGYIAWAHCHAVSMMLRHPRYHDETWSSYNRAIYLAEQSFQPEGPQLSFAALRSQSSVVLEEIRMNIDDFLESFDLENDNTPSFLLHGEFLRDRFNLHGYNLHTVINDMGLEPHNYPGLRMTAEHPTLGEASIEIPIPIGYGCTMHHEYDYVMVAGMAANALHYEFSSRQREMAGSLI